MQHDNTWPHGTMQIDEQWRTYNALVVAAEQLQTIGVSVPRGS